MQRFRNLQVVKRMSVRACSEEQRSLFGLTGVCMTDQVDTIVDHRRNNSNSSGEIWRKLLITQLFENRLYIM